MSVALAIGTPFYANFELPVTDFNALKLAILVGTLFIIHDLKVFSQVPKARRVILAALVSPVWVVLRSVLKARLSKNEDPASSGEH